MNPAGGGGALAASSGSVVESSVFSIHLEMPTYFHYPSVKVRLLLLERSLFLRKDTMLELCEGIQFTV